MTHKRTEDDDDEEEEDSKLRVGHDAVINNLQFDLHKSSLPFL